MSEELPELPEGWVETTVGDLVPFEYGKGLTRKDRRGGDVPVYSSAGHVGFHDEALSAGPTVIVGRKGAAGKVQLCEGPAWTIDTAFYAEVPSDINPAFIYFQLVAANLRQFDQSTAVPSLSRPELHRTRVLLPPREEQDRIVVEVERLIGDLEAGGRELDAAREELTSLRLSLLYGAFSEEQEYRPLGELAHIRSGLTKGRKLRGEVVEYPYLRAANVRAGELDLEEVKWIEASRDEADRLRLQPLDVLLVEGSGSPSRLGAGWLWEGQIDNCLHQNHVFAVRTTSELLDPRYLAWFLQSPSSRAHFLASSKTTSGLSTISRRQVSALAVPLPSLERQQAVIDHLEATDVWLQEMELSLLEIENSAGDLKRSIVHRATTQRTVPADPTAEDAAALLARVRLDRSKSSEGQTSDSLARRVSS